MKDIRYDRLNIVSICIYTFEAFPLPTDFSKSVDFVCFANQTKCDGWIEKQVPFDILSFSSIRQEKIVKILPWKYLSEYDYAIWCESQEDVAKAASMIKTIEENPYKDVYFFEDAIIDRDFYLSLNGKNLNLKSQLEKYLSLNYNPDSFYLTNLIAFNNKSKDFKKFSINWMNETLKESLNDEVSFSWLLSVVNLNICYCEYEIDTDCFFKIVIPNYNNGSALEKCVNSILSQHFKSFKIVIVDDCSTDESLDLAKRYAEEYPEQIYFVSTDKRSYSGKVRNVGKDFNPFTSKYTWFVDGDDMLYKDTVLKDLFEKASITNADLISFDCSYVKNNKVSIKKFSVPDFTDCEQVLGQFGIAPWHRIVKTSKVVSFFENCTRRQDLATVFRQYANCSSVAHLNKVCYIYNVRDYASLHEPVWSLENVYLEMMKQSRELSEKYSRTILHYFEKYPKIFGWLDEEKLKSQKVVAMASYPLRRDGMMKVFNKLFPQCDHFCLYLNEYEQIPDEFINLSKEEKLRITIEIGGENLKDYGKFFWWKKFPGYYLTVDDDLEYPDDYVEKLTSRMPDFKNNAVLGGHGNDFNVVDNSFVSKKHCHSFLAKEMHDVPVDCLGTGVACFYPDSFSFKWSDIVENHHKDNDLDMSVSILVKSESKMLYRFASKKDFVGMNEEGINFVNPLADIHFAWEKRFLQYDFWLQKDSTNKKCSYCVLPYNKVDLNLNNQLSKIRKEQAEQGIDFYFIPIEERTLLADAMQLYFVKFEFVKKFIDRYDNVSVYPIGEKDVAFDFTKDNADEIISKIWKIKDKNLKRMSDKILKANIRKM